MDRVEELEAKRKALIMDCYNIINSIDLDEKIDLKKMTMSPGIAKAMSDYLKKRHEIEEINKEINAINRKKYIQYEGIPYMGGKRADKIVIDEFDFKED